MGSLRKRLAFGAGSRELADLPTAPPPDAPGKKKLAKRLAHDGALIADLQERLYAESTAGGRRSLLLVLQGIDTAGKGGVTEHVVGACGPIGVQYTAFKKPTEEEAQHDFLWRIRRRLPPPGVVAVFDRSHYEDVIVPVVHHDISEGGLQERYDAINGFEQELVDAGTTILKCFLHISYGTQRERLLARLDDPEKHWKFNPGDLDERALWPDYQRAYQAMLQRCDTTAAPWYVVPSDSKAYRNWAVGRLLRETLESLDPHYPAVQLDVPVLRQRLQPPH
jgi:PPK2 family polyphosphate:nucleotide phosphotransferase